MDGWINIIVQFHPSYFAFLSGIAISIGTKLVIGIAIEDYLNRFGSSISPPTILFFVSGFIFIILSWGLEKPHKKWETINRELWPENEIRKIAADRKAWFYWGMLVLGFSAFIMGIISLFLIND